LIFFDKAKNEMLSFEKGAAYLKSVEIYDSESNSWKLHGGMNYRRLGGGVGVIRVQQYDSIFSVNNNCSSLSMSTDDNKNRSLSKLVDL